MQEELNLITAALRKLYIVWEAHKWAREARRAMRAIHYTRARIALDKYEELRQML